MQETLRALLGLQQIDQRIFDVEAELRRHPEELGRRQEELEARMARLAEIRSQASTLRSAAKEIEDYTTVMRQRQRKLLSESSKGKIDAAMLASYEHEIRTLKRTISQAEEDALKQLETADGLEEEGTELDVALETERSDFEEFRGNVESELAAAEARRAELSREREELSSEGIAPAQLDLYRRLLETREGEALAELADGHCQVCFVQIPKNLGVRLMRGTEIVQCPSCDRILHMRA